MKVYDIVLAYIRAVVVLDLIRELATFAYLGVRYSVVMPIDQYPPARVAEGVGFLSPTIGMIVSLVILAASRPIARFAAKFANDVANQF